MTEKRFVLEDEELQVGIKDNGKYITILECVNLLNDLNDENKILKNKIGTYHSANELLKETIDRLRSDE